jgi:hypothetical protein
MFRIVALVGLVIITGPARAAVFAAEQESEPQTDRARAGAATCPYHFDSDMPLATFCVYEGVAFGNGGEVCATDVVVIWSSAGSETPMNVRAEKKVEASKREVYVGFVAEPELVVWAMVDAPQRNRAELVGYTMGTEEVPRPLAGTLTLGPLRSGASGPVDELRMELRGPRPFRPGSCAFASYSGRFLGVIRPPSETDTLPRALSRIGSESADTLH